ncbi:MAG: phosphoribosyltransferase family protein [Acidilobaceae archaeon]|nr:phosphoribosyltransferase family protein [Acidilobaceae archaeon]MCX8165093.1 phosphoribosyltransferase family protein [Acidilobaceae archaeon]MDW7974390.1 phosphoribosyltransferase family protein [Sulfolobales archaeon]
MSKITIRFLGHLSEVLGKESIEIEAEGWKEALLKLRGMSERLADVIEPSGEPSPAYMVFVDGVDYRIAESSQAREIVLFPVVHGGSVRLLSWEEIATTSQAVADKILKSGFMPDVVVGILRGGIVPALLVADLLGVDDVGTIEVKLYQAPRERRERPFLRQPLLLDVREKKVLLVDDVSDSGLTLELAIDYLKHHSPAMVKTATLYVKPWTRFVPDYYAETTESWLVFPWGRGEFRRASNA